MTIKYSLINSTQYHDACESVGAMHAELLALQKCPEDAEKVANAGIQYLTNIEKEWMREEIWAEWSKKGHKTAAACLRRPVADIVTTTNHLESFNNALNWDSALLGKANIWMYGNRYNIPWYKATEGAAYLYISFT